MPSEEPDPDLSQLEDPRVYLAAERTLLAWVRTGLAMMGFGFVVARFGLFLRELAAERAVNRTQQGHLSLWLGTSLVLLGVLVHVLAARQHARFLRRLRSKWASELGGGRMGIALSILLALLGIAMAIYLVATRAS
jgi:putative membrane protein